MRLSPLATLVCCCAATSCNPFPSFDGLSGDDEPLFRENFEQTLDTSVWIAEGAATFDRDTTLAAHGTGSWHAHGASHLGARLVLPESFYLRFFLRVDAALAEEPNPITFALLVQNGGQYDSVSVRADGDPQDKRYGTGNSYAGDYLTASAPKLAFDVWTCVEWYVAPNAMRVWVDENELGELSSTKPTPPNIYQEKFGLVNPPAGADYDAWFDEIMIDEARIGCARF